MSIVVVAICDANTLIPARVNDFLLTAAERGLFELVLSEPILAEVERNLILIHADIDPAKLTARVEMMRRFFKDQIVTGFEDDIDRQPVNEHDRHVTAAALAAGADIVVTNDGELLDEIREALPALKAMKCDEFGLLLIETHGDEVLAVLDAISGRMKRRPRTAVQLAAGIKELLPNTGATLTERLLDRDNTAAVNKAVRPRKTTKDDKKGTRRCVGRTAKDEQCRYDAPEGQDRCNRPHHH